MIHTLYMTTTLDSIQTPETTDCATRIEWAGERLADLADGTLPMDAAHILVAYLMGWADISTEDEMRQYFTIAGRIDAMARAA